jgi:flavorubredoxin
VENTLWSAKGNVMLRPGYAKRSRGREEALEAKVDEIGDRIFRVSTFMPHVLPPVGLTFNEFIVLADEPLLFHCGHRKLFLVVSAAVARVLPLNRLRWISFGHLEADECGAMNEWLTASPDAQIVHGVTGCRLSIDDMADRPARALSNGDLLDLGGRRVRFIDTPHVPHGLDAGVIYEEETSTLFCGDLFAHGGNGPALTTSDILAPATARGMGQYTSLAPGTAAIVQGLARLAPTTLAVMHGTSFRGDGGVALAGLANHYMGRLEASLRGGGGETH